MRPFLLSDIQLEGKIVLTWIFLADSPLVGKMGVVLHITLVSDLCKRNHSQTKAFQFAIAYDEEHIFHRNGFW